MKLYTRFGDQGRTALFDGSTVPKNDPRVCAYGEIDELNAHLGLVLSVLTSSANIPPSLASLSSRITRIQNDLFTLGAELATPESAKNRDKIPLTTPEDFARLESWIDEACDDVPELRAFILPAGCLLAAQFHVSRTVCRRAERALVALTALAPVNPNTLIYLNRLSDLLFAWSRLANQAFQIPEQRWTNPRSAS